MRLGCRRGWRRLEINEGLAKRFTDQVLHFGAKLRIAQQVVRHLFDDLSLFVGDIPLPRLR
jgi:hypothetical protein